MVNNETRYGNVSEEYTGRNWAGGCTIGGGGHRAREKELHLLLHGANHFLRDFRRKNGPFMIILHPTNNLITRILIGEKQVELL